GWLGVGWSLKGVPEINRVSKGKGTPWFDGDLFAPDKTVSTLAMSTDVFMLGDDELTPCNEGGTNKAWPTTDSASCSKDGLGWVNKIDDHRQIRYELATNNWVVRDPDGTTYVFESVGDIQHIKLPDEADKSYELQRKLYFNARWLLTEVRDAHVDATGAPANVVSYSYACEDYLACRVTRISWKSAGEYVAGSIDFIWEDRPDPFSDATGLTLADYRFRLGAVEVTSGGKVAKVYRLGYEIGAETGRSRLLTVTPYGADATAEQVVDTNVSPAKRSVSPANGTALKPYVFDYQEGVSRFPLTQGPAKSFNFNTSKYAYYGDFDGDRKDDFVNIKGANLDSYSDAKCTIDSLFSKIGKIKSDPISCDYAFSRYASIRYDARNDTPISPTFDINGDGLSDIVFVSGVYFDTQSESNDKLVITIYTPGIGQIGSVTIKTKYFDKYSSLVVGDFNGDGIKDIANPKTDEVFISSINGEKLIFSNKTWSMKSAISNSDQFVVQDIDGDGVDDIVASLNDFPHQEYHQIALISKRDHFATKLISTQQSDSKIYADVNGDGRNDELFKWPGTHDANDKLKVTTYINHSVGSDFLESFGQTGRGVIEFTKRDGYFPWNIASQKSEARISIPTAHPILASEDFNIDGRADAFESYAHKKEDGTSELNLIFFSGRETKFVFSQDIGANPTCVGVAKNRCIFVGDYDGDGQPDLYSFSGVYVRQGGVPDLLTSVTTPLGGSMTIAYAPSSDPAVTSSTPADMPFVTQVVRSITTDSAP
ncbi:FG-GAP-like repeat-containing protein, partial [Oryzibacter oryziterrae]|uniref:FG-GAP-like repeat-containing protein n=1 Tax=Oryzibacter oryziterrae TaxID=2766474 RepID=UPI001F210164